MSLPTRPKMFGSDNEESDEEILAAGTPKNLSERRRIQNVLFETWLASDVGQQALKSKSKGKKLADSNDEDLSVQSLVSQQGVEIAKNPRQYQLELFERAKEENTIAVLDTGSGKTLIAVLLLRWTIDNELECRAAGGGPKISFFVVASVTLVYQQSAVLETNMDHKVATVCGPDNANYSDKLKWTKLFAGNQVIVCTADILLQCLARSYITMKQINLLIFDEAHHTKKYHPFARIIKDFYVEAEDLDRPRIFGMTASPIDAKSDVKQAAHELETLLHSKIATTTDMSFTDAVKRPAEQILRYSTLPAQPYETNLLKSVRTQCVGFHFLDKQFEKAREIARHLGRWCSDAYLTDALSQSNMHKYERELEKHFYQGDAQVGRGVTYLDEELARLKKITEFIEKEASQYVDIGHGDLSSKVVELQKYLEMMFERPSEHRCIVFVQTRATAQLLHAVFKRIGTPHTRSGYLTGGATSGLEETTFNVRRQFMTLVKFRRGDINCLFATSVAEEGLDVPDCNLVIRFDVYSTMIQYVQSRGRARSSNSKFIHMIENGNSIHTQLLQHVRYQEQLMRNFCSLLPQDRRLDENEDDIGELLAREKTMRVYVEPTTGAKLNYSNSLGCLAVFVSAIPTTNDESMLRPTYAVKSRGQKFQAEVILPPNSPIKAAEGRICSKKTLARRSAAFEMCMQLRKEGLLDEHLLPAYERKLPAMRNALLAVGMDQSSKYVMRTKPIIWEQTWSITPEELWMTSIDFPEGLERQHQPLVLLTRTPMISFPAFTVYLDDGRSSIVKSQHHSRPIPLEQGSLEKLTVFTLRIFRDVFSKTYEHNASRLSYWLAPATIADIDDHSGPPTQLTGLNWTLIDEVYLNNEYKWTCDTPNDSLLDKFLVDKWDGSRKFYSKSIAEDLKPLDPVPKNTAKAKWSANILDYSVSLYKNARVRASWNIHQPVMEAEKILTRRNMLAQPNSKETDLPKRAFLCPEPLMISALPPSVVVSCLVWPAIIHRFESHLIALEVCALIGIQCEPRAALASITKDSDNSGDEETAERVHFQYGMGENYERLEFLGDTFLKVATTISTFVQNPNDNEFDFHVKRMLMLCNKNLFQTGLDLKLYEYIRSMAFSRRLWYPEGLKLLEGKGAKNDVAEITKHSLGQKTIADVCEALIGAALLSHNLPGAWRPEQWENAVRAVTKLVNSPNHTMMQWCDYSRAYELPKYQTDEVSASQRDLAEKVRLEHPYHFKYPRLLRSAFTHSSQPLSIEKVPNYQRLEFLGDALLDMASVSHIFYRFPDKDPQWLTEHKMAMVSNKFLGAVCVNLGFYRHLKHSDASLLHLIQEYVTEVQEAKRLASGAVDYWTTVSDPPKCLPDVVESFVGAMFIDSDFDYNEVQRFFDMHIKSFFEDLTLYDSFANNHPCTQLHHLLQTTYGCADYRLIAKEIPTVLDTERKDVMAAVMVHDEVVAYSKGNSGRYAKVRAAQNALKAIEGLAPLEFRSRFGCSCCLKVEKGNEGERQPTAELAPGNCNI